MVRFEEEPARTRADPLPMEALPSTRREGASMKKMLLETLRPPIS